MSSDDEDWDSEFGVDAPQVTLSLQRKLTIGNLSKKSKSRHDLASLLDEPLPIGNTNNNNNSNNNNNNSHSHPITPNNSLPGTPIRGNSNNNNNNSISNGLNLVSKFMESDEDDWDSIDSPSKSITQGRKEESDEEDWDAEFGGNVKIGSLSLSPNNNNNSNSNGGSTRNNTPSPSPGLGSPQMKILGIRADPNQKAEWDDDFLFNDSSESENKLPQQNILSRVRSGPVTNLVESTKLPTSLNELLSLMTFTNEIDEKQLFINPIHDNKPVITQNKLALDIEFKKNIDNQTKVLEQKQLKGGSKLEISKIYYEMGLIYQQYQQQITVVFNQFSTAHKIYQEYTDDFDTPLDEDNTEFEMNLYYQLGMTSRLMANLLNATEYLKKSLELTLSSDQKNKTFAQEINSKVNLELGICYMTTDTPIYATKYFETLLRSVLFSHCPPQQHSHSKECLNTNNLKSNTSEQWSLITIGCYQMGKTLKQSFSDQSSIEIQLGYLKASLYSIRKLKQFNNNSNNNHNNNNSSTSLNFTENDIITLINELKKQQIKNKDETSDLTTARDFESDDEEDWDAELGLNVEDERPILQLTGQSPVTSNSTKDRMPGHYKLLETIQNQTFEIVKYPKPSYLFSLTTGEGHLFLHEEALQNWLSNLIVKHLQGQDRALRVVSKASLDELILDFEKSMGTLKISTKQWARTNLEFCFTLHLFGHDETCWDTIFQFFLDIRDYSANTAQQRLKNNFINPNATLKNSVTSSPTTGNTGGILDEKEAIYHYALQLLYLASKLWTRELDSDYKHMCNGLKALSSVNSPFVDLIMSECYAHHLYNRSRSRSVDSDDRDSTGSNEGSDEGSDEEPEFRTRPGEFYQNEEEKVNPIQIFLKAYHTCSIRLQQQTTTSANVYKSIPQDKEYYEIGSKNIMARALVDIHFYLNGISPLTTKRLDNKAITSVEANVCLELLDANVRMKILSDIYPELPPTYLKAKAAYALGLNATDMGDLILAEKFLFECLYIIDQVKAPAFGLPLVLSELAANASISYAEVLLDNFKYQYAIISYDNALLNLNLRKKPEYGALLRRVASLARENDDINTSIYYFKQILNNYLEDNPQSKTNEIIYICGVISSLYWEKGNYKQSEEYLKVVYFILSRPNTPNLSGGDNIPGSSNANQLPKFDNPLFFTHQLSLANLYLESYHFEKGLELLEFMKKHALPHGKTNQLIFLLAKVYTKKGWFDEATQLLSQIDNDDSPFISSSTSNFINSSIGSSGGSIGSSGGSSGFSTSSLVNNISQTTSNIIGGGSNKLNKSTIPTSLRQHGSGGNKMERNLKYWELQCLNYYHSNKFPEAIVCIECAIETCQSSSLASRGQYFYIRGKVFQKLISIANDTTITFPTSLRPTGDEWRDIIDSSTSTTYNCSGDFIQECIASYKRAYHYYKTIGDDVKIQKIVSRIAETYLDRLFGPVALLHSPYDNISRLSHFPTSKLIQKDAEQEQQLSDLKKRKLKKDSLRVSSTSESGNPPSTSSSSHSSINSVPPPAKEFFITLEMIENPATLALDINIDTCNILQLQRNYLNMAELKLLQGDRDLAISYWSECKSLYYTLFFDGCNLIMKSAPLHFLKKVFQIAKRMLRFLFAFDQELINKNLMLIDSYLNLEVDITQASQRNIESNKPFSYESNPQIEKIFVPYAYQSLTIGKTFKKNRMEVSFSVSKNQKLNEYIHSFAPPNKSANRQSVGSPSAITNLTFGEKTKDEEKSAITGDDVGEKVWGSFHYIHNEIRKYSRGKVTQEELSTKNKVIIKQILKVMQSYKNHLASSSSSLSPPGSPSMSSGSSSGSNSPVPINSIVPSVSSNNLASLFRSQTKSNLINSGTDTAGRGRTPSTGGGPNTSSTGNIGTLSRSMASKYEELSFNTQNSRIINASLQKLVFSLQIDNYFIHYVPSTGRKRFNRIGCSEELAPQAPPTNLLYMEIYIFTNAKEKISVVITPQMKVERILLDLFNKHNWEVDKKKSPTFFGSFNKGSNQNSLTKSLPKFIEKTDQFPAVLLEFLNRTIGDPNGDNLSTSSGSSGSSNPHPPDSPPQERSHNNKDFNNNHSHHKDSHHHHHNTPVINVHHTHSNTQPHLPHTKDLISQEIHGRSLSVGSNSSVQSTNSTNTINPNPIHKYYTSEQLNSISFAKHMVRSNDPNLPKSYMTYDSVNQTISQVFSHREMRDCSEQHPLQLYIFVKVPGDNNNNSSGNNISSKNISNTFDPFNNNNNSNNNSNNKCDITFTNEILSSFGPLLSLSSSPKDPTAEEIERKKAVEDLKQVFSSLIDIIPNFENNNSKSNSLSSSTSSAASNSSSSSKKSQSKFGFFGSSKSEHSSAQPTTNFSTTPLLFICSKNLQIFPWELVFSELFIVRYLSLYDVLKTNYHNVIDENSEDSKSIPCFISLCNSQMEKSQNTDHLKKEYSLRSALYNLFTTCVIPSANRVVNQNHAYHSPLIKVGGKPAVVKKKSKYLEFFDLSVQRTHRITHFIEEIIHSNSIHYPVLIFTYNDLVDLSQIPILLLKSKPICNVLFIPNSKQKEIMSKLFKIYDNQIKSNIKANQTISKKERYQFLVSTIQILKEEFVTPIVFFNPLFYVNNE